MPEARGFEKGYQHIFLYYFLTFFSVIKCCQARKLRVFGDKGFHCMQDSFSADNMSCQKNPIIRSGSEEPVGSSADTGDNTDYLLYTESAAPDKRLSSGTGWK